jgi:excisionase family DNA binding protein
MLQVVQSLTKLGAINVEEKQKPADLSAWISVKEAADRLGVSERRVRQLLDKKILGGQRIGEGRRGVWLVDSSTVESAKNRPNIRNRK